MNSAVLSHSHTDNYFLISDGLRLLLEERGSGKFGLPYWRDEKVVPWQIVERVNRAVFKNWKLKATTLKCLSNDREHHSRVYEMELHGMVSEEAPKGLRWISLRNLDSLEPAEAEHKLLIRLWFAKSRLESPEDHLSPWRRPGWLSGAVSWMLDELKKHVIQPVGSVIQTRVSYRSVVLNVKTTAGDVYFKAFRGSNDIKEKFINWEFSHYFAEMMPCHISYDEDRSWALIRVPGTGILEGSELSPEDEIEDSAAQLARLQTDVQMYVDGFLELGFPDCRIQAVSPIFLFLCKDLERDDMGLAPAEIQELLTMVPLIAEKCLALSKYNIPAAVDYGDISVGSSPPQPGVMFPDWSEPCITHPFFRYFATDSGDNQTDNFGKARMAYLNTFVGHERPDRLLEAWEYAKVLAPLYFAVKQYVMLPTELKERTWEARESVAYYLRQLMDKVRSCQNSH